MRYCKEPENVHRLEIKPHKQKKKKKSKKKESKQYGNPARSLILVTVCTCTAIAFAAGGRIADFNGKNKVSAASENRGKTFFIFL